ncbi:hypothetical protein ABPG74_001488 [Tetrahymena malaccensis]
MGILAVALVLIVIKKLYNWIQVKLVKPNFEGKTVWITGASSGIGEQLAKDFSRLGASLIISSRKAQDLEKVKSQCKDPSKVTVLPLDMSKTKEVIKQTEDFIKDLEKQNKKLDIVIENAGVSMRSEFKDYSFENHEYMTNLNYNGPVAHVKGLLDHFVRNKSGHIVLINSIAGLLSPGMRTSYVGSKHALRGFFDSLRAEVSEFNIKVSSIYPGYVQTNVSANALSGEAGQSFGKTDGNIQEGETIEKFAEQAILAIYKQKNDAVITKSIKHELGVYMRNVSFDLVHWLTRKNVQQQKDALKKAI